MVLHRWQTFLTKPTKCHVAALHCRHLQKRSRFTSAVLPSQSISILLFTYCNGYARKLLHIVILHCHRQKTPSPCLTKPFLEGLRPCRQVSLSTEVASDFLHLQLSVVHSANICLLLDFTHVSYVS